MADKNSFEKVLAEHASMIQRIASTYEKQPEHVQDIVQDVAFALWRSLEKFRGESSLKTFVGRVAHNVCISHVRKEVKRNYQELPDQVADPGLYPEQEVDKNSQRQLLLNAVQSLSLNLKSVVALHLEGFSNGEIAEALSLSVSNVGARLNRGKSQIKSKLEKVL